MLICAIYMLQFSVKALPEISFWSISVLHAIHNPWAQALDWLHFSVLCSKQQRWCRKGSRLYRTGTTHFCPLKLSRFRDFIICFFRTTLWHLSYESSLNYLVVIALDKPTIGTGQSNILNYLGLLKSIFSSYML